MTKPINPLLFILQYTAGIILIASTVVYCTWKMGFEPQVEEKIEPMYYMVLELNYIVKKNTPVETLHEAKMFVEDIRNSRNRK